MANKRKRSNKLHMEYIFVPKDDQALATGTLSTTQNRVNLQDGQLGVMVATHDTNVPGLKWGDFLPAGTGTQDVDAIKIVMGTPYSQNTSRVTGWETNKGFQQSAIIHRDMVRTFSGRICKTPTYHADVFYNLPDVIPAAAYKIYVEQRSLRNDRDFSRNVETLPVQFNTPDYPFLPAITDTKSHLLQNMMHRINLNSQAISTSPSYTSRGNRPIIAFAMNVAGGAGTALGGITCGDIIPVMQTTRKVKGSVAPVNPLVSNFMADIAFVETVNDWINNPCSPLTAASTIELIDIDTAGTAAGSVTDAFIVMGLDEEQGLTYDDVYSTKVRTDVELAEGFRVQPMFDCCELSVAFDGYGSGKEWRIRYDERAFGLVHNMQLAGYSDNIVRLPNNIDESKSYTAFVLDYYDYDTANTSDGDQQAQKRVVFLMECDITCGTATAGNTVVNAQPATVADLNAQLGYWLDSARQYQNAFSINADGGMTAPTTPGTGVYFV